MSHASRLSAYHVARRLPFAGSVPTKPETSYDRGSSRICRTQPTPATAEVGVARGRVLLAFDAVEKLSILAGLLMAGVVSLMLLDSLATNFWTSAGHFGPMEFVRGLGGGFVSRWP